jgi:hypothetical protein
MGRLHCPSWYAHYEAMNHGNLYKLAVVFLGLVLAGPAAVFAAEEPPDEANGGSAEPSVESASAESASEEEVGDTSETDTEDGDAEDGDREEQTLEERLADLISQSRSEDEYRESRRCLSRHEYRDVEIISTDYLLFRKGDRYWLNELKRTCMALRQHGVVLSFNPRGTSQTCENQQVYVVSRFDLDRGFTPTGAPQFSQGVCWLGMFEEIQPEQAALLRETVR